MKRAVVLGGGGPAGIGWESGLVTGLRRVGIDLAGADLVVGTSAGSVVGASITAGIDLEQAVGLAGAPAPSLVSNPEGMTAMFDVIAKTLAEGGGQDQAVAALGHLSETAPVGEAEDFLSMFQLLAGVDWPANFACTSVSTKSGQFRLWNKDAGAPLQAAVASSCSVPGIFPAVPVLGETYMDGGMRDPINADVALGHDVVVAFSCFLTEMPEGFSDPALELINQQVHQHLDELRAGGAEVVLIGPGDEFLTVSDFGLSVMDPSKVQPSFQAGLNQAEVEAQRIVDLWGQP